MSFIDHFDMIAWAFQTGKALGSGGKMGEYATLIRQLRQAA
jgi:hypothetical protein